MNGHKPREFGLASPAVTQLLEYWRSIKPADLLPGRQLLDPKDIRSILPYVWLVDVHRAPLRFRYRLLGTAIVDQLGREMRGEWIDEADRDLLASDAYSSYAVAAEQRLLVWRVDPNPSGSRRIERLILPLADDGRVVNMLLGVTIPRGHEQPAAPTHLLLNP